MTACDTRMIVWVHGKNLPAVLFILQSALPGNNEQHQQRDDQQPSFRLPCGRSEQDEREGQQPRREEPLLALPYRERGS